MWLRADLTGLAAEVDAGTRAGADVAEALAAGWQRDGVLEHVRAEQELARLPAEERAAWAALWLDVQQAVDRMR